MQGGGGSFLNRPTESGAIHCLPNAWTTNRAFTMAEILLSLTIIGVVAAITLPSLTGNINERTWNTQRKAIYARFSQAISLMPAVNGFGTVTEDASGSTITDTAAETFITAGLSKVLKINNICSENLQDCGIVSKITTLSGTISTPKTLKELNSLMAGSLHNGLQSFYIMNTKAAAFETANGESVIVYVNPYCVGDIQSLHWGAYGGRAEGDLYQRTVCANFIFDLNGSKGPNTVGKDIGVMTVMYPSDPVVVAPYPATKTLPSGSYKNASKLCTNYDSEYRLPTLEESYSMFVNKDLFKHVGFTETVYWSSRLAVRPDNNATVSISANMATGEIDDWNAREPYPTWCVKR